MNPTTSSPLPVAAIPVERFVERLYAPLAWEATVRLGDPAIASRLVERELHRAWEERERFATFEALYRHVQDAAIAAIQREADRRRDVTRFEGDHAHAPVPGSLDAMSVDAVRRRIAESRTPIPTPTAVIAVTAVVTPPAAPVVAATPLVAPALVVAAAPSVAPEPAVSVARAISPAPVIAAATGRPLPRPSQKPRISMSSARLDAPVSARVAAPPPARTSRSTGSMSRFAPPPEPQFQLTEDQKKFAIGGGVLVVAIIATLALRGPSAGDPQARAFAALTDSAGPSHQSARAEVKEVPLLEGSSARLGAGASVAINMTFGDGARALRLQGPVSLSLKSDSSALAAIRMGTERFITAGAVVAFAEDSAGRVLVQVDSGDVVLVRDSIRVRLTEGSVVRIGTGSPMPITRDQRNAAFGWRQGRLQLSDASLGAIAGAIKPWFNLDVRYPADRAPTETASIDVPLGSRDSLVSALETALRLRADVSGNRITLKPAAKAQPLRRAAVSTNRAPVLSAPTLSLPTIPPAE